jgi:hypothetical protein
LAAVEQNLVTFLAPLNRELYELFKADQKDRKGPSVDWKVVEPRDRQRERRVRELVADDALKHSYDFFHAAMIFQHGDDLDQYLLAQLWAQKAVDLDPSNHQARWLACAAKFRFLDRSGRKVDWTCDKP